MHWWLNFCHSLFSSRIKSAEKQYTDAFKDELEGFIQRVKGRAQARIEEATRKEEEEERQKRLGPGGLDPLEIIETLPSVSPTTTPPYTLSPCIALLTLVTLYPLPSPSDDPLPIKYFVYKSVLFRN